MKTTGGNVGATEGRVAIKLSEMVADQLNRGEFAGLRWAQDMPDDEPDADLRVTDGDTTYVLEVDVSLYRMTS